MAQTRELTFIVTSHQDKPKVKEQLNVAVICGEPSATRAHKEGVLHSSLGSQTKGPKLPATVFWQSFQEEFALPEDLGRKVIQKLK